MTPTPTIPIAHSFVTLGQAGDWFGTPFMRHLVSVTLVSALIVILGLYALMRVHRSAKPMRTRLLALPGDTRAVATIEFALVFPVLLFFMLLMAQTTTLMGGSVFIHYSAYAAARAAIVQIPEDYDDDRSNYYTHLDGYSKHDEIRKAAYLALLPAAGQLGDGSAGQEAQDIAGGFASHFSTYGTSEPNWVDRLIRYRVIYAEANTDLDVMIVTAQQDDIFFEPIPVGETYEFGPKDPVAVNVYHRFNLAIPWIQRIYADGEHSSRAGFFREMQSQCVLNNEGIREDLPPEPEIERRP